MLELSKFEIACFGTSTTQASTVTGSESLRGNFGTIGESVRGDTGMATVFYDAMGSRLRKEVPTLNFEGCKKRRRKGYYMKDSND
jgi:hypothetical protein